MDESVFHRLYAHYHNDVFKFLIYLTRNRDQAEDLSHEVYVRVLKAYAGFERNSSEKTWLFSIAKNVAIDYFRKNTVRRKHVHDQFDWETRELVSNSVLPDDFIVLNEEMKEVLSALDQCTGDQKIVVHMRFLHEFSIAEAAEILGWTEAKVKTTQHRAIKALQDKLVGLRKERGEVT